MTAEKWTDEALGRLEKRIEREYTKAGNDLRTSYDHYLNGWDENTTNKKGEPIVVHHAGLYERYNKEYQAYQNGQYHDDSGKYTDEQMFNRWWVAQEGRGQHYKDMIDQMDDRLATAGITAKDYTNGALPSIWCYNSNSVANLAKESAMEQGVTGIRFDLVDEHTVRRLMVGSREVKPYKPIALDLPKMSGFNRTKIQNALLEGILAGDSIGDMAKRFQQVSNMNMKNAIRNARTAVTGAQNGGKQARYEDLADQGCITTKIWVATDDDRTREEHADADGQEVPFDEPFDVGGEDLMYPADPSGSPWNIYNCRCCTQAGSFKFIPTLSEEYKEIDETEETEDSNTNQNTANSTNTQEQHTVSNAKEARKALVDVVGFESLGRVGALNEDLLVASTNQLINLESKFNVVHSSTNPAMVAKNSGNAGAYVTHSVIKPTKQTLSLCPSEFSVTEATHVTTIENAISRGWHMPAEKGLLSVYDVTHEYGHMLENKTMEDMYSSGYASQYIDFMGRIDYIKAEKMAQSDIKDEIIAIARFNNPNFDLSSNISRYGQSNSAEFFAEVFANSQLGQPNELGKAMNEWLAKKGY